MQGFGDVFRWLFHMYWAAGAAMLFHFPFSWVLKSLGIKTRTVCFRQTGRSNRSRSMFLNYRWPHATVLRAFCGSGAPSGFAWRGSSCRRRHQARLKLTRHIYGPLSSPKAHMSSSKLGSGLGNTELHLFPLPRARWSQWGLAWSLPSFKEVRTRWPLSLRSPNKQTNSEAQKVMAGPPPALRDESVKGEFVLLAAYSWLLVTKCFCFFCPVLVLDSRTKLFSLFFFLSRPLSEKRKAHRLKNIPKCGPT